MKITRGIFVLFLTISCIGIKSLTVEQIAGSYQRDNVYSVGSRITLNKDMSFQFEDWAGLYYSSNKGTWSFEDGELILNSEFQPNDFDYIFHESTNENPDSLYITIKDMDGNFLPFATCFLMESTDTLFGVVSDLDGDAVIPKQKGDSLLISFLSYRTIRHPLNDTINSYEFRMSEGMDDYKFFTNEIWKFRKGKLYPPKHRKMNDAPRYFEKVK